MTEQSTSVLTTWRIDPAHSQVQFAVRHLMISTVKGSFGEVNGTIVADESDPASASIEATIGVGSVDTRQSDRDAHLRSPDFFDTAKFPTITFRSKRIVEGEKGQYRVTGDLTIRDVTREAQLNATFEGRGKDPWGNDRAAFSAATTIDRRDWGLTYNQALETGGVAVGHDIKLTIDLEATKQQ